jgi:hypothetical protein
MTGHRRKKPRRKWKGCKQMANAKSDIENNVDQSGTYRLAALIEQANHARSNGAILAEETVPDQCPEVVDTGVAIANGWVTTDIGGGGGWVPRVTNGDVGGVECGVNVERGTSDGGRLGDSVAVSISGHTKNNLVGREIGRRPGSDGSNG